MHTTVPPTEQPAAVACGRARERPVWPTAMLAGTCAAAGRRALVDRRRGAGQSGMVHLQGAQQLLMLAALPIAVPVVRAS